MELACPQCGETNRDDSVDFPFCTHCHEALVKCGYCASFDAAKGICRDPKSGRRKVSSDDQLDCGRYRSILATTTSLGQRVISPARWVLMVAATLFALIVIGKYVIGKYAQPTATRADPLPVEVRAEWPTEAPLKVGQPFELRFVVTNRDTQTSGPIRLAIPAAFLDRFKVLSIDPSPTNPAELLPKEGSRNRRYWHYHEFPSVPPEGERVIVFELVTNQDFVKKGFPFQKDRYAYDLTGRANEEGVKRPGVHVYNSTKKGTFIAPRVLRIQPTR